MRTFEIFLFVSGMIAATMLWLPVLMAISQPQRRARVPVVRKWWDPESKRWRR